MALASASHGVGGGSRIADFWRISAVFDPIRGGPEPRTADRKTRAFFRLHDYRRPDPASSWPVNFTNFYRQPNHGPRAGRFEAGNAGRGPASLTAIYGDLNGKQRA